jgi:hypothetical protein
MNRLTTTMLLIAVAIFLPACETGEAPSVAPKKAAPVVLVAPKGTDDTQWQDYLKQVVQQNMNGVTDRVYPYYLPVDSTVPTPGDSEGKSQYDRQLDNVSSVVARTVLPGNMLVFGSPDSKQMADLVVAAFTGAREDALRGSQVLFIGRTDDRDRVREAVEAAGAKFIFVDTK